MSVGAPRDPTFWFQFPIRGGVAKKLVCRIFNFMWPFGLLSNSSPFKRKSPVGGVGGSDWRKGWLVGSRYGPLIWGLVHVFCALGEP